MPTDNRRLPVPDDSRTPSYFASKKVVDNPLVDESGKRQDGRSCNQVRPIFVKAGVVSQAKGSAYVELDHTKVICAVYGPREVTKREDFSINGQLNCEMKYATFCSPTRRKHQQDGEERELSAILQEALEPAVRLEKFPKARMDVFVTVLQDAGSALAAAVTCASSSLADAGVEMYDLVIGCHIETDGSPNDGSLTVGFMPSLHQVSALSQNGNMDVQATTQCIKTCVESCQHLYPVVQQALEKAVKRRLQTDR